MEGFLLVGVTATRPDRLEHLFVQFRQRSDRVDAQYVLAGLAVLVAVLVGFWVLSRLVSRDERRQAYDSAGRLFLALCKAHRLAWSERWLLWRVARFHGLRDPARLFLEPALLEAQGLSRGLAAKAARLRAVRARVFSGMEEGARARAPAPSAGPAPALPGGGPLFPVVQSPGLDLAPWDRPQPKANRG